MMARRHKKCKDLVVAGLPQLFWCVEIYASCPKCGKEMTLGGTPSGNAIVVCDSCKHTLNPTGNSDTVAKEILNQIAQ